MIKGVLVISEETVWDGVRIRMEESSQILIVDPNGRGLTILNSYLAGCDVMWKGIRTAYLSNLSVHNSFIQSAEFGIYLESGTGFACTYTEFIDDYIGIAVGRPFDNDQFDQKIEQRGQLIGCKFYTDSDLPDPYPDQYYYPSWPSTPTQVPFNKGYAAIFLSGVAGFNIGFVGATEDDRNEIYHMRNGILLRNSVADIVGTDFHDFEGSKLPTQNESVLNMNQYGINSFRCLSIIEDNTIDKIMVGVYSEESYNSILYNHVSLSKPDQNLSLTRGISAKLPQRLMITGNHVNNGWRGISVEDVHTAFEITKNRLERDLPFGINAGIFVRNQQLGSSEVGLIRSDTINIAQSYGEVGIWLVRVSHDTVDRNIIHFTDLEGVSSQNAGILASGTAGSFFSKNHVYSDGSYIFLNCNGIDMVNSFLNILNCNTIENFWANLNIVGMNTKTSLSTNLLNDGHRALQLVSPNMIGIQQHTGNQWLGNYNGTDEFGALIVDSYPSTLSFTAANSRFYVDSDENPDFLPVPIGPSSIANGVWFRDQMTPKPTLTCESVITNPFSDPDTLAQLIRTTINSSAYDEEITWMVKVDVFEMILLDPGLHSNSVLDSFFDAEESNPLGKLISWQFDLSSRFGVQKVDKELTQDTIRYLSEDIVDIDSILALNPSALVYATWVALRKLKVDSLSNAIENWLDFLNEEFTESESTYSDIADDLDGLTTGNNMEENLKQALLFKAQYLLGTSFSNMDSSEIVELGQLCPWLGGRAVVTAQELYATFVDSSMIATLENCPTTSPYIGFPVNSNVYEGESFYLYPNPVADQVEIVSESIIINLFLLDLQMKPILKFDPMAYKFSFSTKEFPAGYYTILSLTDKGTIAKPLIIVK